MKYEIILQSWIHKKGSLVKFSFYSVIPHYKQRSDLNTNMEK